MVKLRPNLTDTKLLNIETTLFKNSGEPIYEQEQQIKLIRRQTMFRYYRFMGLKASAKELADTTTMQNIPVMWSQLSKSHMAGIHAVQQHGQEAITDEAFEALLAEFGSKDKKIPLWMTVTHLDPLNS